MIVNVVGLASVGVKIKHKDLQKTSAPGVYYNPGKFSGSVIRLKKPRCCLLVFSNGKVVIAGGRTKTDLETAVKTLADMLQKIGYSNAKASSVTLTNVVASSQIDARLNIDLLNKKLKTVHLDKERFPGALLELPSGGKAVCFASGKFYVTGLKEEQLAINALKEATDILLKFQWNE